MSKEKKFVASHWTFLANGRFEGDDLFIRNAPGLCEKEVEIRKEFARDDTIYCGQNGIKKHGHFWRKDLPQPDPKTYLDTHYVPGCEWETSDDDAA